MERKNKLTYRGVEIPEKILRRRKPTPQRVRPSMDSELLQKSDYQPK